MLACDGLESACSARAVLLLPCFTKSSVAACRGLQISTYSPIPIDLAGDAAISHYLCSSAWDATWDRRPHRESTKTRNKMRSLCQTMIQYRAERDHAGQNTDESRPIGQSAPEGLFENVDRKGPCWVCRRAKIHLIIDLSQGTTPAKAAQLSLTPWKGSATFNWKCQNWILKTRQNTCSY